MYKCPHLKKIIKETFLFLQLERNSNLSAVYGFIKKKRFLSDTHTHKDKHNTPPPPTPLPSA